LHKSATKAKIAPGTAATAKIVAPAIQRASPAGCSPTAGTKREKYIMEKNAKISQGLYG
jgi:hypothetical protein